MHWQDYVFAVGSFFLIITLIPMLRAAHKPPLHSSLPVAAILFIFAFTYGTLGFALAPVIEFVQGSLWLWLAWQRHREPKAKLLWYGNLGDEPWRVREGKLVASPKARLLPQLDPRRGRD